LRTLPILALAILSITACEKSPPPEPQPAAPAVVATDADIVGRWIIHSADLRDAAFNAIKAQVEARELPVDDQEIERHVDTVADFFRQNPPIYTFDADHTMTLEAGEVSYKGAWSVSGDTLTVSPEDAEFDQKFRFEPGFLRHIPRTDWGRSISLIRG
jgi:hypothetical protein